LVFSGFSTNKTDCHDITNIVASGVKHHQTNKWSAAIKLFAPCGTLKVQRTIFLKNNGEF
jgi:hypothetical protein